MSQPFIVPLPADFDLDDSFVIRVTALDPATGDTVAGVDVAAVTFMVDNLGGGDLTSGTFGPFLLVPGASA